MGSVKPYIFDLALLYSVRPKNESVASREPNDLKFDYVKRMLIFITHNK